MESCRKGVIQYHMQLIQSCWSAKLVSARRHIESYCSWCHTRIIFVGHHIATSSYWYHTNHIGRASYSVIPLQSSYTHHTYHIAETNLGWIRTYYGFMIVWCQYDCIWYIEWYGWIWCWAWMIEYGWQWPYMIDTVIWLNMMLSMYDRVWIAMMLLWQLRHMTWYDVLIIWV